MFLFVVLIICVFPPFPAYAQELTPALRQRSVSSNALDQWQNGVDAIRGQMEALIKQNDQLTRTYDQDKARERILLKAIDEQRNKITALNEYLKQRAGKTDQQLRINALNDELSVKRLKHNKILLDYKTQHAQLDVVLRRIEEKRSKVSAFELTQADAGKTKQAPDLENDPALVALRKELERQKVAEAKVSGEMDSSQTEGNPVDLAPLQAKLAALQNQKAMLLRKPLVETGTDKNILYVMQAKKEELELKIRAFERRIDVIKTSLTASGSWAANRKELVRSIVQGDARNKRLTNEINDTKENIALLRAQIGSLEKRVLFSKTK